MGSLTEKVFKTDPQKIVVLTAKRSVKRKFQHLVPKHQVFEFQQEIHANHMSGKPLLGNFRPTWLCSEHFYANG